MDNNSHDWYDPNFLDSSTHGHSTGLVDPLNNGLEFYGFNHDQTDDFKFDNMVENFGVDNNNNDDGLVFDNNGHGGHGNLSYGNQPLDGHHGHQSFPAPADLNGHRFFDAPVGLDGYQSFAALTALDGSSCQNSNQDDGSFTTPAIGSVEQVTGSVENGKSLVEKEGAHKRKKAASAALKDKQQDSDADCDSDAEEDEDVDGKTRRKSYSETRILTRWNTGQDQLLLLALQYECDLRGMKLPWGAAVLHVNGDAKPDAVTQHLTKVRKARIYYGMPVPPLSEKEKEKGKVEGPSIQHSDKDIRNFATLTYTKPGTDEEANGAPGTLLPVYTPQRIEVKPQLPYYGKPGWPLSIEKADEAMADLALRGSRWSKTTPLKIELQDDAPSTKKKGRSAKVIKVEQADEDDDEYVLKSTRKAQSTPTASQKKKAQASTPKSASKGSSIKPKGVEKSKKASTPLRKTKAKALADRTPISALAEEFAATKVKSSPARTPSKKAAAAAPKKSIGTKKGKAAKATAIRPPSEEETLTKLPDAQTNNSEQPVRYGRREEDIRVEPSETFEDSMNALPAEFGIGRSPGSQSLGFQAIALDNPSSGSQSAMPNVPDQSMQHQSGSANNMSQFVTPNMPIMPNTNEQPMQHQGGQIFGNHSSMAIGSGPSMQNQGNYGYNSHGQQMLSTPMHHHGQHMQNSTQIPEQQWQMQGGQNPMMNNNMLQTMPQFNQIQQANMLQMMQSLMQQPGVMAQLTSGQGFPGFGMDTSPMVREHLPGFGTEMHNYMTSNGTSATQSPRLSFDSNTTQASSVSVSANNVDSKPQTLEGGRPEAMLDFIDTQLNNGDLDPFEPNDHY